MNISKGDIPLSVAVAAHGGTSWTPEKRGEQIQEEYLQTMTAFYTHVMAHAKTDAEREYMEAAAERYRQGYIQHYTAYLHSKSRVVSSAIAGPSNFPARMMQKRNGWADAKYSEFQEWDSRAKAAILKGLKEMRVAAAGGPAVIMRQEIEAAEKLAGQYVEIRKRFRKEPDPAKRVEILKAITGLEGKDLAAFVAHNYIDADGLPAFRMTNNNARIKAMRLRLEEMEKRGATPTSEKTFDGGRVVDNQDADRIQIFFNERPGPELYGKLKARGFRWSPTAGAWQRYRTQDTRYAVEAITGVKI